VINDAINGCSDASKCEALIGGHAYTTLGAMYLKSQKEYIFYVRNPWGVDTFTGKYSDSWLDKEENKDIKEEIEHESTKTDGCFWMSGDDYLKYFSSLTIG